MEFTFEASLGYFGVWCGGGGGRTAAEAGAGALAQTCHGMLVQQSQARDTHLAAACSSALHGLVMEWRPCRIDECLPRAEACCMSLP